VKMQTGSVIEWIFEYKNTGPVYRKD